MTAADIKKDIKSSEADATKIQIQITDIKQKKEANATKQNSTAAPSGYGQMNQWWSARDAMTISASVLFFGLIAMLIAANLMRKTTITADGILKVFGMILLIFGSIFLVVSGYSQEQMGPVMGLLGTIAGFIFGRVASSPPVGLQAEKDEQSEKKGK